MRYQHITPKGSGYEVRLRVPIALCGIIGRAMMRRYLRTGDPKAAREQALPVIASWLRMFEVAKAAIDDDTAAAVLRLKRRYAEATQNNHDGFHAVIDWLHEDVDDETRRRLLRDAKGDLVQAAPTAEKAEALQQIVGVKPTLTPFCEHLDAFIEKPGRRRDGAPFNKRTITEFATIIRRFAHECPMTLEECHDTETARETVQRWCNKQALEENLAHNTIQAYLNALRSYWAWMADTDRKHVRGLGPFRPIVNKGRPEKPRPPFEPKDVMAIYQTALDIGEIDAADAFLISAHSSMRRGAIAKMKVTDFHNDENIDYITIDDDKTESGKRTLPLHPVIKPITDRRIAEAGPNGLLFPRAGARNGRELQAGLRRVLNHMGLSKNLSMHSARHSAQAALEARDANGQRLDLKVRKNIMGHKVDDITEGRYGAIRPLDERFEGVKQINYPNPKTGRANAG